MVFVYVFSDTSPYDDQKALHKIFFGKSKRVRLVTIEIMEFFKINILLIYFKKVALVQR